MKVSLLIFLIVYTSPLLSYGAYKEIKVEYINLLIPYTAESVKDEVEYGGTILKSYRFKSGGALMIRVTPENQLVDASQQKAFPLFFVQSIERKGGQNLKHELKVIDDCNVDYFYYEELLDEGTSYRADYVIWCGGRMGIVSYGDMREGNFNKFNKNMKFMKFTLPTD